MSLGSFAQALAEEKVAKWLLENWPVKLQFGLVCPITWVDGKSLKFNSLTDPAGNPIPFAYPLGQCKDYTDQSFDSWQERVFASALRPRCTSRARVRSINTHPRSTT